MAEYERDLVFIGGGHTHALVLRQLAMKPIDGVRVTLISSDRLTPYSGMLPGYVAGHYSLDDIHIDLHRLCKHANVRFIADSVTGLDPYRKTIQLSQHADVQYDKVSINTGSTPNVTVPGAAEFALGVKPIQRFAQHWSSLLDELKPDQEQHWAVIGSGAAGVEIALAMAHRLQGFPKFHCSLVTASETLLTGYNPKVQASVARALNEANINVVQNFKVAEVSKTHLVSTGGQTLDVDQSLWCTPAVAPNWPKASGLDVDAHGFIAVDKNFRSTSHPDVYAVGDVSAMIEDPRPKAGVYAVRSAPFLADNLRASFAGEPQKPATLQSDFLSLLALGDQRAVGQRSVFSFTGRWVWRWKDRIDRTFMDQFGSQLPKMSTGMSNRMTEPMHCAGCGSKLGPELLNETLASLGLNTDAEDASQLPNQPHQWQSLDGFRAFTDDLYQFGVIATHHAVNDCYAMGIEPTSAQVWANLAFAHPRLIKRDFQWLMQGITDALSEHETQLIGGHSSEGAETHLGLVVNGEGDVRWRKTGLQADDWLILNRPIGSGILLAADMQGRASAASTDALWQHLLTSNRSFFKTLQNHTVRAATDITGFGLIGHVLEMLSDQSLRLEIYADQVPLLDGVLNLSEQGVQSSLLPQLEPLLLRCVVENTNASLVKTLLDPQTQGGLLVSVPETVGQALVASGQGVKVGQVTTSDRPTLIIR